MLGLKDWVASFSCKRRRANSFWNSGSRNKTYSTESRKGIFIYFFKFIYYFNIFQICCGKNLESEMAQFVRNNIKLNSIICCDHSIDAMEILKDFSHIDQHISSNKTITTYLKETVSKFSPVCINFSKMQHFYPRFLG